MLKRVFFLAGLAAGAGLMYVFDPIGGARRRSLVRDQLTHLRHEAADALDSTREQIGDRATGAVAETRRAFTEGPVDDRRLEERVRSTIGRVISHPGAIEVTASNGRIILRGQILRSEVDTLISAVRSVSGVNEVTDLLEAHETPGNISALQGGRPRS